MIDRRGSAAWTLILGMLAVPTGAIGQTPADVPPAPTAAPVQASGASADYRIGPSDVLSIAVYRAPELTTVASVAADGSVTVPGLGRVSVDGMTMAEADKTIARELSRRGILIAPSVTTIVSQVRSKVVTVMGAVARPGEVPLTRPDMSYSTVLALAGATFGTGNGIVTILIGGGASAPRQQISIGDIVSGVADRPARSGDTFIVQSASTVYVSGEVGKPGGFPLQPGMTVGQAIALGGGVTQRGSGRRLQLTRTMADGSKQKLPHVTNDTLVEPNDLIVVNMRIF